MAERKSRPVRPKNTRARARKQQAGRKALTHALVHLDGEVNLIDRAEDLIDLANGRLVLEVDRGVEVGNLGRLGRGAEHLGLDGVEEGADLCRTGRVR